MRRLGRSENNFLAAYFELGGVPSQARPKDGAKMEHPIWCAPWRCSMFLRGSFGRRSFRGAKARQQALEELLLAGAERGAAGDECRDAGALEKIPAKTRVEDWVWTRDFAVPLVERQLQVRSLEGFGLVGHEAAAIAAGVVLHYVRTTQKNEALHIDSLKFQEHSTALELDQVTVRNLELVEPLFAGQDDRATLFHTLDACHDADGKAPAAGDDSASAD